MPKNLTWLAVAAVAVVALAMFAALAGSDHAKRTGTDTTSTRSPGESSAPAGRPADPVIAQATRYALTARNWSSATYRISWRRQVALAGGSYRRELARSRPRPAELRQLADERSSSSAQIAAAQRDPTVTPPAGRVIITLQETTIAKGQTIRGQTVNEVRLRQTGGRWRVVGWTVIPGAAPPAGR